MRLAVIVSNDCTVDLRNLEHRRLHCRNLRSATARATNGSGAGEIGPAEGIPDPGCSWCNPNRSDLLGINRFLANVLRKTEI
jgi:hypothetical protein